MSSGTTFITARNEAITLAAGPVNLDAESVDWLTGFWFVAQQRPRAVARALFIDRPRGYVRATGLLAAYAASKATAMRCRLDGRIATALDYERVCDGLYERLPAFARW